jgi:hypothetical protein
MTSTIILFTLIKQMAVGLGVGSSTIAIANFFVAIHDGKIEQQERRMMQVTYVVLRVAMLLILASSLTLLAIQLSSIGLEALTPSILAEVIILFVLYTNATLMTLKVMPSTVGPALQAASWYTLGITSAISIMGIANFNVTQFVLGYVAFFLIVASIVNIGMHYLKK